MASGYSLLLFRSSLDQAKRIHDVRFHFDGAIKKCDLWPKEIFKTPLVMVMRTQEQLTLILCVVVTARIQKQAQTAMTFEIYKMSCIRSRPTYCS